MLHCLDIMDACLWLSSLVQIQRICIDPRQVLSLDLYLYLIFSVLYSYSSILHYIDQQFERYLGDESGLNRRNITDNRVHACFYFISPAGHGWVSKFLYIILNLKKHPGKLHVCVKVLIIMVMYPRKYYMLLKRWHSMDLWHVLWLHGFHSNYDQYWLCLRLHMSLTPGTQLNSEILLCDSHSSKFPLRDEN